VPAAVPVPAGPVGGAAMSGCDTVLPAGAPPAPADIGFDSWVLQDVDTGAILAAKDPHARERPASLMKLLLALVVSRNLDPGQVITGTQDDANQEGTRVGIGPGGQYTVDLLLHGLLMASGNDIAHALAMAMGGVPQTVAKMNALAHSLGALDTRAATPSGLDGPGMSASAYDLSLIFRAAIRTPVLAAAMSTARIGFPGYGGKPPLTVYNDNHLLTSYAGDFAGKTGYTDDAQHTFANAAAQQGHRIALIMMHGTNHLDGMYQNAKELMNYAFALVDAHTTAVGQLVSTSPAPLTPANALAHTTGLAAAGHPGGGTTGSTMPPPPAMSAFGNVGGPLTVLAAIAVVAIAIFAVRRQRTRLAAERRRLAERKALREAQTIRVAPVRPVAPRRPAPSDKSSTATSMTGPIWPTQDQH
jgi:D-alanyl-D-alanine carboxypeptidase (penicillin-binding protein 5/6)